MPKRPPPRLTRTKRMIYLGHEQLARLKWEQVRTGASVSELIRRAVDQYLPPLGKES